MSNYEAITRLIRTFAGKDNVIGIPRAFIRFMGSLQGGALLSQLIYWSDKGGREDGWFYKTYQEWSEDIGLSEYEVRKWAKAMGEKGLGFLETRVMKANGSPTVHYRLDMQKLSESFLQFLRNEDGKTQERNAKISDSLTETTSEITTNAPQQDESNDDSPIEPPAESAEPQQATLLAFPSVGCRSKGQKDNGSQQGKAKRSSPSRAPNPNTLPIMDAYIQALGYSPANYAKEAGFAKRLAAMGYIPEQVATTYRRMKAQSFWQDKFLSLCKVAEQIGEDFPPQTARKASGEPSTAGGYRFLNDDNMFL